MGTTFTNSKSIVSLNGLRKIKLLLLRRRIILMSDSIGLKKTRKLIEKRRLVNLSVIRAENECFTEDSGIFKMSLNDGSLSRTCYVKNEIVEQSFHWNEGDFSSNAISEPWSVENRGQDLENFRNLTENES